MSNSNIKKYAKRSLVIILSIQLVLSSYLIFSPKEEIDTAEAAPGVEGPLVYHNINNPGGLNTVLTLQDSDINNSWDGTVNTSTYNWTGPSGTKAVVVESRATRISGDVLYIQINNGINNFDQIHFGTSDVHYPAVATDSNDSKWGYAGSKWSPINSKMDIIAAPNGNFQATGGIGGWKAAINGEKATSGSLGIRVIGYFTDLNFTDDTWGGKATQGLVYHQMNYNNNIPIRAWHQKNNGAVWQAVGNANFPNQLDWNFQLWDQGIHQSGTNQYRQKAGGNFWDMSDASKNYTIWDLPEEAFAASMQIRYDRLSADWVEMKLNNRNIYSGAADTHYWVDNPEDSYHGPGAYSGRTEIVGGQLTSISTTGVSPAVSKNFFIPAATTPEVPGWGKLVKGEGNFAGGWSGSAFFGTHYDHSAAVPYQDGWTGAALSGYFTDVDAAHLNWGGRASYGSFFYINTDPTGIKLGDMSADKLMDYATDTQPPGKEGCVDLWKGQYNITTNYNKLFNNPAPSGRLETVIAKSCSERLSADIIVVNSNRETTDRKFGTSDMHYHDHSDELVFGSPGCCQGVWGSGGMGFYDRANSSGAEYSPVITETWLFTTNETGNVTVSGGGIGGGVEGNFAERPGMGASIVNKATTTGHTWLAGTGFFVSPQYNLNVNSSPINKQGSPGPAANFNIPFNFPVGGVASVQPNQTVNQIGSPIITTAVAPFEVADTNGMLWEFSNWSASGGGSWSIDNLDRKISVNINDPLNTTMTITANYVPSSRGQYKLNIEAVNDTTGLPTQTDVTIKVNGIDYGTFNTALFSGLSSNINPFTANLSADSTDFIGDNFTKWDVDNIDQSGNPIDVPVGIGGAPNERTAIAHYGDGEVPGPGPGGWWPLWKEIAP